MGIDLLKLLKERINKDFIYGSKVGLIEEPDEPDKSEKEETDENTGAGAVAGFSGPLGDNNSIVRKKSAVDEGEELFAGPLKNNNSIMNKKSAVDEGEEDKVNVGEYSAFANSLREGDQDEKTFNSKNFEITRAYRGPNKGYTLMIKQVTGNGTTFQNDAIVQQILNQMETLV